MEWIGRDSLITGCTNKADMDGTDITGIVAVVNDTDIINCKNTGDLTTLGHKTAEKSTSASGIAMIGNSNGAGYSSAVRGCANTGRLEADSVVGLCCTTRPCRWRKWR